MMVTSDPLTCFNRCADRFCVLPGLMAPKLSFPGSLRAAVTTSCRDLSGDSALADIRPPAPGRFSMTTCCFVLSVRPCASSRMVRSATPPAPNGMDMRIGLVGKPGSARALSFAAVPIIAAKTTARGTRQSRRPLSRRPALCERMVKPPSLRFFLAAGFVSPRGDIRRSAVSVCPSGLWQAMSWSAVPGARVQESLPLGCLLGDLRLQARIDPHRVAFEDLLLVGIRQLCLVDVALGVVEAEAGLWIVAFYRAHHLRGEQDVVDRHHTGQQIDARLVVDAGVEEDVVAHDLVELGLAVV